jgi:DNA polymerase-3 subunit delta
LREIVERYKKVHQTGMGFYVLYDDVSDFDDAKNAIETTCMFKEKKLVVLKHFLEKQDFVERFLTWRGAEAILRSADVICVFFEEVLDKKSLIATWLFQNAKCEEFEVLRGPRLQAWCERFIQKRGIAIERAALGRLVSETKGDLWAFTNEIEKLHAFAQSTITEKDIEVFTQQALPTHIFSLVDAFVEGNKGKALRLLYGHLEAGDDPHYLFSMIHRQFRNIAKARDLLSKGERNVLSIARTLGIHPYVAKKSVGYARVLDGAKMKRIYKNLLQFDYDVKRGALEPRAGLLNLLLSVT